MIVKRDEIMDFFRNDTDDLDNLASLSLDDRYELALILVSHSDHIYEILETTITAYERS